MYGKLHFANSLNPDILSGAIVQLDNRWECKERAFPFSRLYYIYRGGAVLQCNGESIIMQPGNMYLLPAYLPISYHCPESMVQLFFHITLVTPEGVDLLSRVPKICQIPCSQSFLSELRELCESNDYGQLLKLKTCISQNIVDCLQKEKIQLPITNYSKVILQAMAYIQNNLTIQLSGEQIAKAVCVSPSFLYKRFKAETGASLGAYQDKLIFNRATQLLAEQELSLREIGQQLGFCDQYYFSRRFKIWMGITPSRYRKMISATTSK